MRLRYLADTNVLSEPAKPEPNPHLMARLKRHRGRICTAAMIWNELLYGCRLLPPSRRRQKLEHYLLEVLAPSLTILPYDSKAAEWHAEERARLGQLGKTPAFVDGQIAAVAKIHDLVVVTGNVAHFAPFQGLAVEDWSRQEDGRTR